MTTTTQTRYALVKGSLATILAYLPANYRAEQNGISEILISGHDNAGWTLEDYVIPRLASGLYTAREVTDFEDCEGRKQGIPHPTHVWTSFGGDNTVCEAPMFEVVAETEVEA